MPSRIAEP
ncbi:hypothetical protein VTN00DRAFT_7468 [Thermoascus crustaceus]